MPGFSGIELVRKKITAYGQPVFITSHPECALEGFELEAFDYLLKPVSSERFARCAFRLRDFYQMRIKACTFDTEDDSNFIVIKQGYDKYKIPVHDILYVEAMRDYTRVVTAKKQYLVLSTLNGFAQKLPETFVRIHRSYNVNRNKVDGIQKNKINIQSQELPIGNHLYTDELPVLLQNGERLVPPIKASANRGCYNHFKRCLFTSGFCNHLFYQFICNFIRSVANIRYQFIIWRF